MTIMAEMLQPRSDCASLGTALISSGSAIESIHYDSAILVKFHRCGAIRDFMESQEAVVSLCCPVSLREYVAST